jgi:hypothetical protein
MPATKPTFNVSMNVGYKDGDERLNETYYSESDFSFGA